MNSYYLNNRSPGSRSTCKTFLSRFYFSKLMQAAYIILVLLCISSIILNFLIQADVSAHIALVVMESVICTIIIFEISMRIYLQGPSSCYSLGNIADITITALCVLGIVLSLESSVLEVLGEETVEILLVIRNILFLLRLFLVFKHQKETDVGVVSVSRPVPVIRKVNNSNEMKVFRKYRPKMEVLLEEEDEDGSVKSQSAWKGKRIS